uniref:RNA-directed DNA polymerase n=1 Tax=Panagrellus redivivus TaxID=6233 RepID=A0A7E4URW0_PANRE
MDFQAGYYQIPLEDDAKEKTAFSMVGKLYQFTVVPMGLTTSPACFLRLMEKVMGDLVGTYLFVYMDDILAFSKTEEAHVELLREIFERLKAAGLKLKPSKCHFGRTEVPFLGHLVTRNGIKLDADRIAAIQNIPAPRTVTELRSFLGMITFVRQFIANFSKRAAALYELTKKAQGKFMWNEKAEAAFADLKNCLTTAPVLKQPDYDAAVKGTRPFIIYTDASMTGVGGVLTQEDEDGRIHPIYFVAKKCSDSERNYSVLQLEALAMVVSLRKLKMFVQGARIIVRTDHRPLLALFQEANSAQLVRWKLELQAYADLKVEFVKGKANVVADALSRMPHSMDPGVHTEVLDSAIMVISTVDEAEGQDGQSRWLNELENDPEFGQILSRCRESQEGHDQDGIHFVVNNGHLWRIDAEGNERKVVPVGLRRELFAERHAGAFGGHFNGKKTAKMLAESYFWPTMKADCVLWARSCQLCFLFKSHRREKPPLNPYEAYAPWETVGIDLMDMGISAGGSRYVLVMVDHFSKFVLAAPLQRKSAEEVAKALMRAFLAECQFPMRIVSDLGREFDNEIMRHLSDLIGMELVFAMGYNSQFNGAAERVIQTLRRTLAKKIGDVDDWESVLPFAVYAYNTTLHDATNETPIFLTRGRQPEVPSAIDTLREPSLAVGLLDDYKAELTTTLAATSKVVHERLEEYRDAMAAQYNRANKTAPTQIAVNDLVYVELQRETYRNAKKKLAPRWKGPARVTKLGKTHATIVFLGRRGFQDIPLNQLVKSPPELQNAPANVTHTTRRGRRQVMEVNAFDFRMTGFYGQQCGCAVLTIEDIWPFVKKETGEKPKTLEQLATLITIHLSTIPKDEWSSIMAGHPTDGRPKITVSRDTWKLVYQRALVRCHHFRKSVRTQIKDQQIVCGHDGKGEALKRAFAVVEGLSYHDHDKKKVIVIGGRNAEMLAKKTDGFKVISTAPADIIRITNCLVSTNFTQAIIWPEQQLFTDVITEDATERCELARRTLKSWNPHLNIVMMPMIPMDGHERDYGAARKNYQRRAGKEYCAGQEVEGSGLIGHIRAGGVKWLDEQSGLITWEGAGKVGWYLKQLEVEGKERAITRSPRLIVEVKDSDKAVASTIRVLGEYRLQEPWLPEKRSRSRSPLVARPNDKPPKYWQYNRESARYFQGTRDRASVEDDTRDGFDVLIIVFRDGMKVSQAKAEIDFITLFLDGVFDVAWNVAPNVGKRPWVEFKNTPFFLTMSSMIQLASATPKLHTLDLRGLPEYFRDVDPTFVFALPYFRNLQVL